MGGSASAASSRDRGFEGEAVLIVSIHQKAGSCGGDTRLSRGPGQSSHADPSMMLHPPVDAALGNSANLRRAADELDLLTIRLVDILQGRTGQPRSTIHAWLGGDDIWFNAEQAFEAGLVDEIQAP